MEEDILKYENRDELFRKLKEVLGFVKIDEKYFPESFGNFYVIISSKEFLLRYYKDRSYLTIEIANHSDLPEWTDLTFVKNFIHQPQNINPDESPKSTKDRIEELDNFLINDYNIVCDLFSDGNYNNTQIKIKELLKDLFNKRFPGMAM